MGVMTTSAIGVLFLRDTHHGGTKGQPQLVAQKLAEFVADAKASVDIAIYDFRLSDPLAAPVVDALIRTAARGVPVRIAYDAGKPAKASPVTFARLQADPAPPGTADWVTKHFDGTAVRTRAIAAPSGQMMHSKYVLRDVGHRRATVLAGSANFTDDAWTRQENNILTITSAAVTKGYRADFEQLWSTGSIRDSGSGDAGSTTVSRIRVGWDFAPADGDGIDNGLCAKVAAATRRIVLSTMVLTSRPLLAALTGAIGRGVPVSGIYDAGQMEPIAKEWAKHPATCTEVLADWHTVSAHLTWKRSTPYRPTSVHDFMHNKVLIVDDDLVTGSYNLSSNAQRNAENQLHIHDRNLVEQYLSYIDATTKAYRTVTG
jgi:phosphatidylserine/phosphatidylglycerophosphate/cardiolipin synthase-like enzyme